MNRERVPSPSESDRGLVVLDMTLDRFRGPSALHGADVVIRFVAGELRYFRERGRPVFFALTSASGPVIQELTPRSDEVQLRRPAPSAFFRTELETHLARHRVRRLTLVGLETHTSVLLTAADAMSRGIEVVVPEPCVMAADLASHQTALRLLREEWPRQWADTVVPVALRPPVPRREHPSTPPMTAPETHLGPTHSRP